MKMHVVASVAALCGVLAGIGLGCSSSAPTSLGRAAETHTLQELTVATPSGLPACKSSNVGQVAYVQSNDTLYACESAGWTAITIPTGPTGPTGPAGPAGATGATGAPGTSTLITETPVSPGPICAQGGVAIQVGADRNGNGILDPGEVTATSFVCNGVADNLRCAGPQPQ